MCHPLHKSLLHFIDFSKHWIAVTAQYDRLVTFCILSFASFFTKVEWYLGELVRHFTWCKWLSLSFKFDLEGNTTELLNMCRPNVELFMIRTKLSALGSWKVRRLAQLIKFVWTSLDRPTRSVRSRRIEHLKIVCGRNVDLQMLQSKLIEEKLYENVYLASFGLNFKENCILVWFSWLVRRVLSSTSHPTDDLNLI